MLRSIDEDDSGGESETEEGDVLDWELCSSDEMSDNEETEQFDDTQPIVHIDQGCPTFLAKGPHAIYE